MTALTPPRVSSGERTTEARTGPVSHQTWEPDSQPIRHLSQAKWSPPAMGSAMMLHEPANLSVGDPNAL